jgi:small conductance mechanosensitive channel
MVERNMRIFPLAGWILGASVLFSHGVAAAPEPEKPAPRTTADPKIPLKELELLLKPLTKTELAVEADGWLALLSAKAKELSAAEIEGSRANADSKTRVLNQTSIYREEQTKLIDRLNVVISAINAKGGKAEEYEKYVGAVSGIRVDVTDATGAWVTIVNWLKSPEGGIRYGKNIVLFVLTLLIFKFIGTIAGKIAAQAISSFSNTSDLLRDFFVNAVRKVTFFVGLVVALSMLEVNIGPFLAAMGAAGFVIGFALQGTLSNFASGIMILLYRPYDLGDMVSVAGVKGKVESMTLVSTIIVDADSQTVVVPNSAIWGGIITNVAKKK